MDVLGDFTLSPYAFWDEIGITIAGRANGTGGSSSSELKEPLDISISTNDILYISDKQNHRIVVIPLRADDDKKFFIGPIPDSNVSQFSYPHGVLATNTFLFVLDYVHHQIKKLSLNGTGATTVVNGLDWPQYFFVDENMNIYVSDMLVHQILLFHTNLTSGRRVAGSGLKGSGTTQLDKPYGIFVDRNGTIYIADHGNHRIMKWFSDASEGIRVAGDGTSGPSATQITYPTQILVDTNDYMYISEVGTHRITRWGPDSMFGVCIAGCAGGAGNAATQLSGPHSLAFDSEGSLYVSDYGNHRVQKFQMLRYVSK